MTERTLGRWQAGWLSMLLLIFLMESCIPTRELTTAAGATRVDQPPGSGGTKTVNPYGDPLVIDTKQPLQTIRDVGGGNFIHRFGGANTATEPVSEMNIRILSPKLVRVSIDLDEWEPKNDAQYIDKPGSKIRATFEFMQIAQKNGAVIIASVWGVPAWMVTNPKDDQGQIIPRENYSETVESLAAWLLRARDTYGVKVSYLSFNEANLGVKVLLSPDDLVVLVRQAGPRFKEFGLDTKWLLGDTANMASNVSYVSAIWQNADIRPYLGPLAFHSWDASASDNALLEIASFAEKNNLEVWCTEAGWDASLWQRPVEFPDFGTTRSLAAIYTRALKMTRATTFLYWEMMGQDYQLNDGTQPYPSLSFLQQFKQQFPPGAVVLKTSADRPAIYFTAARAKDGFAVVVVSMTIKDTVQLTGLPDGRYYLIRSSRQETNSLVDTYQIKGGSLTLEIAGFSINFLTTRKP